MENSTFETVQTVIRLVTGNDLNQIIRDATFASLDCDSLDTVEITIETETALNIDIPDENMPELEHTVGSFVDMIDRIRGAA